MGIALNIGVPTCDEGAARSAPCVTNRAGVRRAGHPADLGGYWSRVRRPARGRARSWPSRRVIAAVIADSENGCAGQECLPCPNAVTSMGDGNASASVRRWRCHRVGIPAAPDREPPTCSAGGASVAIVQPAGTSTTASPVSKVDRGQHGARHDRALRQPGALERAALREVAVAVGATGRASSGCSRGRPAPSPAPPSGSTSTRCGSARRRVRSHAAGRRRAPRPTASTIRSNSGPSLEVESRCCSTSSMTAATSSSAARSARLSGGGDRGHGVGVHEGVGAVQRVEGRAPGVRTRRRRLRRVRPTMRVPSGGRAGASGRTGRRTRRRRAR